ncbi:hypothetical protein THMIRHAS_01330 [Thiosulfatimonas sediminis]|uniref:Uncharacterized protein n=1 Tax=Thiosulfatimonas sediminis TaxID=2675054 RepID=A0A6F8PRZ5_9GAMM|nr:hypothetical protein [Thiosulfatimonas sediminis]BBP44760.1 hypothetical protein THMIRHAS_01330 [Thiosulfatimonas sediminis]
MSQVIRISDNLYDRLKCHAEGFDTPANVIEKILNSYEENGFKPIKNIKKIKEAVNLEIDYSGLSEEQFKKELIHNKHCYITLYYTNGSQDTKHWKAEKFTAESSVSGNLRSGFLRSWREKGIFKAELFFK